jgi:hypothetical protein
MKRIIYRLIVITITLILLPHASADLNDGLVAYWPFNGNANDEGGNGNDGVVFGATICEDRFGDMDSAYCFDGVDDYINIGNNVKPPFPVSVSVWVNAKDLDANDCGLAGVVRNDQYDDGSYRYGLTVRVSNGYLWAHYFEGFSAPWNRITYRSNDTLISADKWYHLVVIFNAHRDIHLFVDGVEYFGIYAGTGSGMSYSGSGKGAIGQFRTNVSRPGQPTRRTCYFNGIVDDLRIYDRTLSDTEIQQLYQNNIPPGKATLNYPSGTITENSTTYTWNAVANSTWYYLWVNDGTGNKIKQWYKADEANCGDGMGECSVIPATELSDGTCRWWIQTWNDYGYGPWSDAMTFTVDTGTDVPPGKATLISPSGKITDDNPTYTWNAVASSSWYYLWVNDRTGSQIKKWYTADDADCGNGTGRCSVTDKTALADGSCKWWIQTWNVYGYGPWSDAMHFTVDTGRDVPPEKTTLISPSGKITDNTPTYTWNAVANSTWYYLWVNDRKGNQIEKWYTADEANCGNGTGRCSVTDTTELADGSCKWWIQTWNEFGYGPWSDAMAFTVDTPPCTNIAGNWHASETVTLTCCLGGDCETDTFSGTDIITIQQNECNISYDIDVGGYGSFSRKGTINGNKIQLSGVFAILQPWCKAKKNKIDINGKVNGDRINLKGSGIVTGKCDGESFSCEGDSTSTFTRLSYSAAGQAMTGKEFTRESSTQLVNNCIKILTIMDH